MPKDVIVHDVPHHTPVSVFAGEVAKSSSVSSVSGSRLPVYALQGKSLYPKHYFGFLKNATAVWTPRAKSGAFWGVSLGFWAWYALLPHSNMVLRRVFLGEVAED